MARLLQVRILQCSSCTALAFALACQEYPSRPTCVHSPRKPYRTSSAAMPCRFFTMKHGSKIFMEYGTQSRDVRWRNDPQVRFSYWHAIGRTP